MHVETTGSGPRVVLVHGSLVGAETWESTRSLADGYTVVVVSRPGFAMDDPIERVVFERDAALLRDVLRAGDHLVGHSYGGVVSLLAAGRCADLGSLTVVEPPAFALAPDAPGLAEIKRLYANPLDDPREHLRRVLEAGGAGRGASAPP